MFPIPRWVYTLPRYEQHVTAMVRMLDFQVMEPSEAIRFLKLVLREAEAKVIYELRAPSDDPAHDRCWLRRTQRVVARGDQLTRSKALSTWHSCSVATSTTGRYFRSVS